MNMHITHRYPRNTLVLAGTGFLSLLTAFVTFQSVDPFPSPHETLRGSAPEQTLDENLGASYTRYLSTSLDYSIRFPSSWTLDDSRSDFGGDILTSPGDRLVVTITETSDTHLTPEDQQMIARNIEEALRYDAALQDASFQTLLWKDRMTVYTDTTRRIGSDLWRTREYRVMRPEHQGILNISISMRADTGKLFEEAVGALLESLNVCPHDGLKLSAD